MKTELLQINEPIFVPVCFQLQTISCNQNKARIAHKMSRDLFLISIMNNDVKNNFLNNKLPYKKTLSK